MQVATNSDGQYAVSTHTGPPQLQPLPIPTGPAVQVPAQHATPIVQVPVSSHCMEMHLH